MKLKSNFSGSLPSLVEKLEPVLHAGRGRIVLEMCTCNHGKQWCHGIMTSLLQDEQVKHWRSENNTIDGRQLWTFFPPKFLKTSKKGNIFPEVSKMKSTTYLTF